ncbi:Trk system potassium transporter TrkA [Candidatus Hydrogenosomobacter endosymbioticus]|uniref:Trk system potassium uptake protein TrkA n=1 Tax=Candidatus Hydrogenosomobacter endosymbioticus TaxID=2558174 RepID=A0ABN6L8B7_9PROT|nr:Trk system potassium transporter TrkA [Candidatus Hydrogenosomobacter endosymbioticus]BDB96360.1 Trk system potassium transport protein TrkA [Candidatus Hydrogenosomobacter endosymbioticus]
MKIIICGGGQIGQNLIRYLCLDYEVTLIDTDRSILEEAQEQYDIQTIHGSAADPFILKKAQIQEDSVVVSVTGSDHVNLLACQMSHFLFKAFLKVARLRHESYFADEWQALIKKKLGISVILSPEKEAAKTILQNMVVRHAFDVMQFADKKLTLIGVHAYERNFFLRISIKDLEASFQLSNGRIACIIRNYRLIIPDANDQILPGDDVYFLINSDDIIEIMENLGLNQQDVQKVIIFGATAIGKYIAKNLEEQEKYDVVMIEENQEEIKKAACILEKTMFLNGSPDNPEVLREAGIDDTGCTIAVTKNDTINMISSLMAHRFGVQHPISLINHTRYLSPLAVLGIEKMINMAQLTVSVILQHISKDYIKTFFPLEEYAGVVIEAAIRKTSPALKMNFEKIQQSDRLKILAVRRRDKILGTVSKLEVGDHVIAILLSNEYKRFQKIFEPD